MKNLSLLLALLLFIIVIALFSCNKQNTNDFFTNNLDTSITSKGSQQTQDWRNPDPTWIQVTSPILRPAKWGGYVFAGYIAGIQGTYSDSKFQIYDSTIVIKWHLHVGRRFFNNQWKPDVIDYRHFNINALDYYQKPIPNGGIMGDYDFIDTIKIDRWGYYNSMYDPKMGNGDSTNLLYDWNGICPEIHSKATNGWLNDPLMSKYLK